MRKISLIIMCVLSSMCMMQCRKPLLPQLFDIDELETKKITFSANSRSQRGGCENVDDFMHITWQTGDEIHVYSSTDSAFSSGQYCGKIPLVSGDGQENGVFSGDITIPTNASFVKFLFASSGLDVSDNGSFDVFYDEQTGLLDDIKGKYCASLVKPYTPDNSNYSGTLIPNISILLIKFSNVTQGEDVYMFNVNFVYKLNKFGGCNNDQPVVKNVVLKNVLPNRPYYVVVLPMGATTKPLFSNEDCSKIFSFSELDLQAGEYYSNFGEPIDIELQDRGDVQTSYSNGIIGGNNPCEFSVSPNKKVYFSTGNLWFKAGNDNTPNPVWAFADKQYYTLSDDDYNTTPYQSGNETASKRNVQSKWIDMFGWGTTGYETVNTYYNPYESADDNPALYGPVNADLSVSKNSDWGCLEKPDAIGIHASTTSIYETVSNVNWRTLGAGPNTSEWGYLIGVDTDAEGRKFTIDGVTYYKSFICRLIYGNSIDEYVDGLMILSDLNIDDAVTGTDCSYVSFNIPSDAVFLPMSNYRSGTEIYGVSQGFYWSSSYCDDNNAYCLYFNSKKIYQSTAKYKSYGFNVRLVGDAD